MVKSQGDRGRSTSGKRRAVPARRSNSRFYASLVIIAIIGIAAIAWMASRRSTQAAVTVANLTPGPAAPHVLGDTNAPVKVMEFADFECPACAMFATVTEPDVRKYLVNTDTVVMRYYDYPLEMHKNTWGASNAAACAAEQGKFWPMHDMLFQGQDQWNGEVTGRPKGIFEQYAKQLGLNMDQWNSCYDSRKYQAQIQANHAEGDRMMVQQTPTFVIGDRLVAGALGYDEFKAYVDSALAKQQKRAATAGSAAKAPATPAAGKTPATKSGR